jgi:hypothetical protein
VLVPCVVLLVVLLLLIATDQYLCVVSKQMMIQRIEHVEQFSNTLSTDVLVLSMSHHYNLIDSSTSAIVGSDLTVVSLSSRHDAERIGVVNTIAR